jgi:hypothetical protein
LVDDPNHDGAVVLLLAGNVGRAARHARILRQGEWSGENPAWHDSEPEFKQLVSVSQKHAIPLPSTRPAAFPLPSCPLAPAGPVPARLAW